MKVKSRKHICFVYFSFTEFTNLPEPVQNLLDGFAEAVSSKRKGWIFRFVPADWSLVADVVHAWPRCPSLVPSAN